MQVKFDIKYERSKLKVSKKIELQKIIDTELLFQQDPKTPKLELKNIICRRDKHKNSIDREIWD